MQFEQLQHEFERVQADLADGPILPSVTVDEIRSYLASQYHFQQDHHRPPRRVGGVLAPGAMLAAGGSLVVREKFSASQFWSDIIRWEYTVFQYIGELCRYLLQSPPVSPTRKPHIPQLPIRGYGRCLRTIAYGKVALLAHFENL